jgi:hypothetical protein
MRTLPDAFLLRRRSLFTEKSIRDFERLPPRAGFSAFHFYEPISNPVFDSNLHLI